VLITQASLAAVSLFQDKTNTLFSGTVVTAGRARAVVVGTGADTAIGKIRQERASAPSWRLLSLPQVA
jgi:magnesium-transporting ATPase (P-type)